MEEVQSDHRGFVSYHHHPRVALDWLIDMLVERESVWTEISGLSESRKLETPVFPVFYINPPDRLPLSPHSASAVTSIYPS